MIASTRFSGYGRYIDSTRRCWGWRGRKTVELLLGKQIVGLLGKAISFGKGTLFRQGAS